MGDKRGTQWSGAEVKFLRNNLEKDNKYLSSRLGRSQDAVKSMRYKILRGYEISDDDYIQPGQLLSQDEKVSRIYKMAVDMHIRLAK